MFIVSLRTAQEIKRRSKDMFRRSTAESPSPRPESPQAPEPGDPGVGAESSLKKTRFSWFRNSGRRSGVVLQPSLFRHSAAASPSPSSSPVSSPTSSDVDPSSSSDGETTRASVDVTDERSRALDILEGRARPDEEPEQLPTPAPTPNRASTSTPSRASPSAAGTSSQDVSESPNPNTPSTPNRPISFMNALPFVVIPGRSRSGSVGSRRSVSNDERPSPRRSMSNDERQSSGGRRSIDAPTERRASSRLDRVPENSTIASPSPSTPRMGGDRRTSGETLLGHDADTDEQGLPTYASAAYPSRPIAYHFAQAGPFSMTLSAGEAYDEEIAGLGRYHVSVGVNVWAPRSSVTVVRRGLAADGPLVAQIEFGYTSSTSPTLVMGDSCRQLKDVLSRSLTNSTKTYSLGNGMTIVWKLNRNKWQACMNGTPVATFSPNPPRSLVVQPLAHKYMDHILLATLLLMRDKDAEVFERPDYSVVPIPFV